MTPSMFPKRDPGVKKQLAALFGESLFGPWPEIEQQSLGARRPRRPRRWWRGVVVLLLACAVVYGAGRMLRKGVTRQISRQHADVAGEIAAFLAEGDLERTARFVATYREGKAEIDPHDPHLDLIVRAEAAVFRYHDADPSRLSRIEPYLTADSGGALSPPRVLASVAVLSRAERAGKIAQLEKVQSSFQKDPEFFYLMATALEARGDDTAAASAWERAGDLGQLWLSHRFEQAVFERRRSGDEAAAKIVSRMLRADADSPWSRFSAPSFGVSVPAPSASAAAVAAPRPDPPVLTFRRELLGAIDRSRTGDLVRARSHLAAAIDAIHRQAPFMLDALDGLAQAGCIALANELAVARGFPLDAEIAKAKVRLLGPLPAEPPPAAKPGSGRSRSKAKR
jgi:hypothetical protein